MFLVEIYYILELNQVLYVLYLFVFYLALYFN
jgi:hypothetical protein